MSLFTDLRLAFQKLPPRLPRIILTSILVALLFVPFFGLALATDSGLAYLEARSSERQPDGIRAILFSCDESSELCRSGETFTASIRALAKKYDVSVDGSVIFLNAQPFISSTEYFTSELPTDLTSATLPALSELNADNSFGSDLLAQDIPHYGVFRRVISPEYAQFLLRNEQGEQNEQGERGESSANIEPESTPDFSTLIGRFYTETVSVPILVKDTPTEPTVEENVESESEQSLTQEPAPVSEPTQQDQESTSISESEQNQEPESTPEAQTAVPENPGPHRDYLEFTVSYQIIGVETTTDQVFGQFESIDPLKISTYLTTQQSDNWQPHNYTQALAAFARRGLFLYEATVPVQEFTAAATRIEDLPMVQFSNSAELIRFRLTQILTNLKHSISFGRNSSEVVYSPVIVLFSKYLDLIIELFFLTILFVLLTLIAGLLAFLLFCSAQKTFARRNAATLVLLHALRATNFDRRTISAPLRFLLLVCPLALISFSIYYYFIPALIQLVTPILPQLASTASWLTTPEPKPVFGAFSLIVTIIYILAWWLAGLRSRTYNSMKKLSKYIES